MNRQSNKGGREFLWYIKQRLLLGSVFVLMSSLHALGSSDLGETIPLIGIGNVGDVDKNIQEVVAGIVRDSTGTPLEGTSVTVRGTSRGTSTDNEGRFQIQAGNGEVLVFRRVGYQPFELTVSENRPIDVILLQTSSSLDEVVVVGFGTQKKASVTGAISTIRTKELRQSPAPNLAVSLAGRLPGLTSIERTGEPGRSMIDLYIRGRSTVNEQRPLLMVDGIEREINFLDPNEIESVSILKDAAATAIYGVRGANGVILVTTRRGEMGKADITLVSDIGLTNFTRFPNAVNAFEYATLINETGLNDHLNRGASAASYVPAYSEKALNHYLNRDYLEVYPDRDWYEEFTVKFASQNRYNLNVSGGTERVKYFINAGHLTQGGQYKTDQKEWDANTSLRRYNFRSNVDLNLNESLTASLTSSGYFENAKRPGGTTGYENSALLIINAMQVIPANAFNDVTPDGEVLTSNVFPGGHPVYGLINRSGYVNEDRNQINASFSLDQKLDFFTTGLSAKVMFTFDSRSVNTQRRDRMYARYQQRVTIDEDGQDVISYVPLQNVNTPLGNAQQTFIQNFSNVQASLNYARSFNGKHNVTGLFLFNQDKRVIQIELPYNLRGIVGRGTYGYDNRYFAELNFGFNGSEQFMKGKRYGFFPSGSIAWLLSEENFIKETIPSLQLLKLRSSYGIVGNDRFGSQRFLYLDNYVAGGGGLIGGVFNGQTIDEVLLGNRGLTWETAGKFNLGLDIGINNTFGVVLDFFSEKRDNVLINRGTIPSLIGTSVIAPVNYGRIKNIGFDMELNYRKQFNSDWRMFVKGNVAFAKNHVSFIDEPVFSGDYAFSRRVTGYPLGQPFGYKTDGYFNTDGEAMTWSDQSLLNNGRLAMAGDLKYVDVNGDGIIDPRDYVPIGYPNVPLLNFGALLSVEYKGFDLGILLQGAGMVTQTINGQAVNGLENFFDFHLDRWTHERVQNNEPIRFPRILYESQINRQPSDFYTQRSDFLRLKNMEIGYTLPGKVLRRVNAKNIRFYANGLNLFLLYDQTVFKQVDPELAQGGGNSYPLSRVINFGLNITF